MASLCDGYIITKTQEPKLWNSRRANDSVRVKIRARGQSYQRLSMHVIIDSPSEKWRNYHVKYIQSKNVIAAETLNKGKIYKIMKTGYCNKKNSLQSLVFLNNLFY